VAQNLLPQVGSIEAVPPRISVEMKLIWMLEGTMLDGIDGTRP
jgi:hypothetical protein